MALTLNIPVRTSITLPDNWQDCQTPQQLSYWLIARFEELAKTHDINELKGMVAELRAYVDTYDKRLDALVNTDASLGEDITALEQSISELRTALSALENFLSDIDNTLTNIVRDVETNTNDITSIGGQINSLHEAIVSHAQRLDTIEGANRNQNQLIQANTQGLNTLDREFTALSTTVETQAEKFAGLTEAVTFRVRGNYPQVDIIDKDVRNYHIECDDSVVNITINFEFSEMPPNYSEFKFYITAPGKAEGSKDITARLSIGDVYTVDPTPCGGFETFTASVVTALAEWALLETPVDPSKIDWLWYGGDVLTVVLSTGEDNAYEAHTYGTILKEELLS